ncbi:MAG: O-methyltransferase [Veillonellales bacterium]
MKETSLLSQMEQYALQYRVPIISPAGASLLVETVRRRRPSSVLEIGTAIGYSTLLIAAQLPSQAKIVTIEQNPERARLARQYLRQAGKLDQVTILIDDAGEAIPRLDRTFDFVFIDAAKGQYLDYLQKVVDKLMARAVVIADNIFFRGLVEENMDPPRRYRTIVKRLRQYIDFITMDQRFITDFYHVGDGIAVSNYQGERRQ